MCIYIYIHVCVWVCVRVSKFHVSVVRLVVWTCLRRLVLNLTGLLVAAAQIETIPSGRTRRSLGPLPPLLTQILALRLSSVNMLWWFGVGGVGAWVGFRGGSGSLGLVTGCLVESRFRVA